jgi:SRSO17 transposase
MGIATLRVTELGAQDEKKLRRELERVEERLQRFFPRREMKEAAVGYLEGLLSAVERKNSWQMSEAQGHPSPYRFQHLLDRANWDADAVRDDHLQHVATEWGKGPSEPYGVLVLDETGFLKKGEKSAGVARQYSGTAGRIENCQIGVFLSYVTPKGRLLLDRELYLPQAWVKDKERCLEADIPEDRIELHTKGALGLKMLKRAVTVGIWPEWVTGDEVYGKDYHLRRWLEESAIPYVLAVASNTYVWRNFEQKTVNSLLAELQPSDWKRLSCGTGAKDPRLYDWALLPINSFDLPDKQARAVLFRRSISRLRSPHWSARRSASSI